MEEDKPVEFKPMPIRGQVLIALAIVLACIGLIVLAVYLMCGAGAVGSC